MTKTYTLPDLPYDYSALEPHYSAKILELHHDKHHAAYVQGVNDTMEKLAEARDQGNFGSIVGLQKNLAFNLSGHVLHSVFWQNLAPDGGGKPEGDLAAAIDEYFGSFGAFKAQLTQATTTVQGSGWGSLAWEPLGERLYVEQIYDHQDNVGQSGVNLLVFDAWEHAYYLQYFNVRGDYVERVVEPGQLARRRAALRAGAIAVAVGALLVAASAPLIRREPHWAAHASAAEPAVAVGVLPEVLLVVGLGVVERAGRSKLGRDVAVAGGVESRLVVSE